MLLVNIINDLFGTNLELIPILLESKIFENELDIVKTINYKYEFVHMANYFCENMQILHRILASFVFEPNDLFSMKMYSVICAEEFLKKEFLGKYKITNMKEYEVRGNHSTYMVTDSKNGTQYIRENIRNIDGSIAKGEYDRLIEKILKPRKTNLSFNDLFESLFLMVMAAKKDSVSEKIRFFEALISKNNIRRLVKSYPSIFFVVKELFIFFLINARSYNPTDKEKIQLFLKIEILLKKLVDGYGYKIISDDNPLNKFKIDEICDLINVLFSNKCYKIIQFIFAQFQINSTFDVFNMFRN